MIVDITHHMFKFPQRNNDLGKIRSWLEENVGPYYGPGTNDDHSRDIWAIGKGWQIEVIKTQTDVDSYDIANVVVDIDDGPKATWFAMMWGSK